MPERAEQPRHLLQLGRRADPDRAVPLGGHPADRAEPFGIRAVASQDVAVHRFGDLDQRRVRRHLAAVDSGHPRRECGAQFSQCLIRCEDKHAIERVDAAVDLVLRDGQRRTYPQAGRTRAEHQHVLVLAQPPDDLVAELGVGSVIAHISPRPRTSVTDVVLRRQAHAAGRAGARRGRRRAR